MAAAMWWWWPTSPWLTPGASWFIFFNVVVGTIAVKSWWKQEQGGHAPAGSARRRLARTASTVVLESFQSFSVFSFHHAAAADYGVASSSPVPQMHHLQDQYSYMFRGQEAEEVRVVSRAAPELATPEPAAVAGESGVTGTTVPVAAAVASESEKEESEAEPAPVAGESGAEAATSPPSAPVAASAPESEEEDTKAKAEAEDAEESISLDKAYALARAQARRPSQASGGGGKGAAPVSRRSRACGRGAEEVEGKAEVNARAELFIRQFREELKLQRLNSIIYYTTELRRRAGIA